MKIQYGIVVGLFALSFVGELPAQGPAMAVTPAGGGEAPAGPRANASIAPTFRQSAQLPLAVEPAAALASPDAALAARVADSNLSLRQHVLIGAGIGAVIGAVAIGTDRQADGNEQAFGIIGALAGATMGAVAGGIVYVIRRM
jgi:hypothetical protein